MQKEQTEQKNRLTEKQTPHLLSGPTTKENLIFERVLPKFESPIVPIYISICMYVYRL